MPRAKGKLLKPQAKRGKGINKRPARVCELCGPRLRPITSMFGRHLAQKHAGAVWGTFRREGHRTLEVLSDKVRDDTINTFRNMGKPKPSLAEIKTFIRPPVICPDGTDWEKKFRELKKTTATQRTNLLHFFEHFVTNNLHPLHCYSNPLEKCTKCETITRPQISQVLCRALNIDAGKHLKKAMGSDTDAKHFRKLLTNVKLEKQQVNLTDYHKYDKHPTTLN